MDRVAQALNLSPIEVRRKNLIQPSEMPYQTIAATSMTAAITLVYSRHSWKKSVTTNCARNKRKPVSKAAHGHRIVIGVEPGGAYAARDMAIFPGNERATGAPAASWRDELVGKERHASLHLGSPNCGQAHETTHGAGRRRHLGIFRRPDQISTQHSLRQRSLALGRCRQTVGNTLPIRHRGDQAPPRA